MLIPRQLHNTLADDLSSGQKGIVLYGPRQVGKTTLINSLLQTIPNHTLFLNGDQRGPWWESLVSRELSQIQSLISDYDTLFIDEAQRIPEIGLILKIILDNLPSFRIIVTGSSSLDLASKVSEPLTGRVHTYHLYPISQYELRGIRTPHELTSQLEERLIFGSYPRLFSYPSHEARTTYLRNLTDSYLYRDLLEFADIRNSAKIRDLLKLLAFQIGSQVSESELARTLELSRSTVERYIDLLEKSYVVFRLSGFSRNLRKEVTKMDKIYFYDLGIRNLLIGNLNQLANRDDAPRLWENFLVTERLKLKSYTSQLFSHYYWRLSSGAELDLVEEENGQLSGFEFKYSINSASAPQSWQATYPHSSFATVNRTNWLSFLTVSSSTEFT